MSLRVPLTLACRDYDRTLPLAQGDVRPAGVDLTYLTLPVEETFFRMTRFREFEAAELPAELFAPETLQRPRI